MLPAVILAAGASRRMGSPKPLLPDKAGVPFVVRICDTLREAGLRDIVIVTGAEHDRIAEVAAARIGEHARLVRNPDPGRGQLSSLHVGMTAAISEATEALLVTLVDVPFVTHGTVGAVLNAWRLRRPAVTRPMVGDRHGHPVIFDRRLFDELRATPLDVGAKQVIRAHAAEIENVLVPDAGCLVDVDTRADYEQVIRSGEPE